MFAKVSPAYFGALTASDAFDRTFSEASTKIGDRFI